MILLRVGKKSVGRRRRAGFTLMEIILAVAITGFIMTVVYATLFATLKARDRIEKESLIAKVGPAILDMIEQDVSGAWCMNIHNNDVFYGEHRTLNGVPADNFHLITTTDSTYVEESDEEAVRSDLSEVSYRLRANPAAPDLIQIFRRQDFHVDDKIAEGGIYELIYSRIRSFEIFYYKDLYEGADRLEEWDAKKRNRLPAAMEIFLSLEIDPRLAGYSLDDMERPTQNFHRVIFFPTGSELTMSVRPVIPSYVDPEENQPGEGGGGPGGGGPGGDGEGGGILGGGGGGGKGKGGKGDGDGQTPPDPNKDPDPFEDPFKDLPGDDEEDEDSKKFPGGFGGLLDLL